MVNKLKERLKEKKKLKNYTCLISLFLHVYSQIFEKGNICDMN